MSTMEASEALKDHLKNHLSDLLQTHESYQIQWESRLNYAVAECAKECQKFRSFIMNLKIHGHELCSWLCWLGRPDGSMSL